MGGQQHHGGDDDGPPVQNFATSSSHPRESI
jgi:hypothetical protein